VLAIDTNVFVRFVVADDPAQTAAATQCVERGVYVTHGVLMEAEWVLRRRYGWTSAEINNALLEFLSLETVHVSLRPQLKWALDRHLDGADWADMLHLIAARDHDGFATFDKAISKKAGLNAPLPIVPI
jgi:predicted nucleic-acid-binding protein